MTDVEINEAVARKLGMGEYDSTYIVDGKIVSGVKDYCHSIEAAWEIVAKWQAELWTIGIGCSARKWDVTLVSMGEMTEQIYADTAPMAICLAFLKLGEK